MSYVNTLIVQALLSRPEWRDKLTTDVKRALNLLFHSHINPYGLFPLDLSKRLLIAGDDIKTIGNRQSQLGVAEEQKEEEFI